MGSSLKVGASINWRLGVPAYNFRRPYSAVKIPQVVNQGGAIFFRRYCWRRRRQQHSPDQNQYLTKGTAGFSCE